jgi:Ca2+-binding EF-hand superfamily protein
MKLFFKKSLIVKRSDFDPFHKAKYSIKYPGRISEDGMLLMDKIFKLDPNNRPTCIDILDLDPWICNNAQLSNVDYGPDFRKAIKDFAPRRILCKAFNDRNSWSRSVKEDIDRVLPTTIKITVENLKKIKEKFLEKCREKSVTEISREDFHSILPSVKLDTFDSDEIFEMFDIDCSKSIDRFEFLLSLYSYRENQSGPISEEQVRAYFEIFDVDCDGTIDRSVHFANMSCPIYYANI